MVQRQVWRHHCLISEPECLTHSRHQDSTHTRTSTIKTSRPEWEVIKAWWDKMTFNRDRVMKWKADFFRFPRSSGRPNKLQRDKSELLRCLFGKWPPCTFPRSLSHLYFKVFLLVNIYFWLVERVSSSSCTLSTQRSSKAHHHLNKVTRLALRAFYCSSRETKIFYCK